MITAVIMSGCVKSPEEIMKIQKEKEELAIKMFNKYPVISITDLNGTNNNTFNTNGTTANLRKTLKNLNKQILKNNSTVKSYKKYSNDDSLIYLYKKPKKFSCAYEKRNLDNTMRKIKTPQGRFMIKSSIPGANEILRLSGEPIMRSISDYVNAQKSQYNSCMWTPLDYNDYVYTTVYSTRFPHVAFYTIDFSQKSVYSNVKTGEGSQDTETLLAVELNGKVYIIYMKPHENAPIKLFDIKRDTIKVSNKIKMSLHELLEAKRTDYRYSYYYGFQQYYPHHLYNPKRPKYQ